VTTGTNEVYHLYRIIQYISHCRSPFAARSKAWICGLSLADIVCSNTAAGLDYLSLVSVVCCQVVFCVSGQSLVQRSPIECDVSECDLVTSTVRRPRPRVGLFSQGGGKRLAIKSSVVRLVMISMKTRNLELQRRGRIRSDIELSTVIQKLHRQRRDTRVRRSPLCFNKKTRKFPRWVSSSRFIYSQSSSYQKLVKSTSACSDNHS